MSEDSYPFHGAKMITECSGFCFLADFAKIALPYNTLDPVKIFLQRHT
jgi:hypothetical protein